MVHSLAKQNGFHKFDEMFREVHRSNMSKLCTNMEDVNMSLLKMPVAPTLFELWMKHNQRKLLQLI
jgi:hypothetical protein